MAINATSTIGSSATVTLRQQTAGRSTSAAAGIVVPQLGLTDAELDRITAGLLQIGNTASGDRRPVSSAISRTDATNLSVTTGGRIFVNQGNHISVDATAGLSLDANLSIDVGGNNAAVGGAANLSAGDGGIRLEGKRNDDDVDAGRPSLGRLDHLDNRHWRRTYVEGTGATTSVGSAYGVFVAQPSTIQTLGSGDIEFIGTGGRGHRCGTRSVPISAKACGFSPRTGNITIEGYGGGTGTSFPRGHVGAYVHGEHSGSGWWTRPREYHGRGGTTSGNGNYGVFVGVDARVTSSGGSVTVDGTGGGNGTSSNNFGAYVVAGGEISAGSGDSRRRHRHREERRRDRDRKLRRLVAQRQSADYV
ncbi:MAG: hypothetical protein R3B90_12400 [Planctomycetaceae bacterium]